jgi:hypothetical protein
MAATLTKHLHLLMALAINIAPEDVNLTKNPVYVELQSSGHTLLDNYRVVLRLLVELDYLGGTFTQVLECEAVPDSNGVTNFDLGRALHSAIERASALQVPDLTSSVPFTLDTTRRFRFSYLEKYGTPQVSQPAVNSAIVRAVVGGVDAHNFLPTYFFDNVSATNSLLTQYPSGKVVARDQPEYLTFLRHASGVDLHAFVRVRQFGNTGTLLSQFDAYRIANSYASPLVLDQWQAGVFSTGPTELGLNASAVRYTVQVFTVGTIGTLGGTIESGSPVAASQAYTYYITEAVQPDYQDLIWFNSFRTPHILRCTGRRAKSLSIDRLLSDVVAQRSYSPQHVGTVQHDRSWNNAYQYRSGSLRPEEKDALEELLIENRLFAYDGGKYHRLLIKAGQFAITETEVSPNYLEFTAERSLAPVNFERELKTVVLATSRYELNEDGDQVILEDNSGFAINEM